MRLREGLRAQNGHLIIGGCDATQLAETYGTPLYIMDEAYMRGQARAFRAAMDAHAPGGHVVYANKPFCAVAMAKLIEQEGLFLDVVSEGELRTVLAAGFPVERIEMHGSNKSETELEMAVTCGLYRVIIDSLPEVDRLADVAKRLHRTVDVDLRVNPGIDAHTHEYIKTATVDSKFGEGIRNGRAMQAIDAILARPELRLHGVHFHIGSQLFDMACFDEGLPIMANFAAAVHARHGLWLEEFNIGGGFGVYYTDDDAPVAIDDGMRRIAKAMRAACDAVQMPLPRLVIEPGRAIVAEAGVELYRVGTVKPIPDIRTYISVDGGLMDNPRPGMYQAAYSCALANRMDDPLDPQPFRVSGKCCETDMLFDNVALPLPRYGDILAVFSAGAYQYAMSGNYHRTPKPAVVFVKDGRSALVVRRQTFEELIAGDAVPEWMEE